MSTTAANSPGPQPRIPGSASTSRVWYRRRHFRVLAFAGGTAVAIIWGFYYSAHLPPPPKADKPPLPAAALPSTYIGVAPPPSPIIQASTAMPPPVVAPAPTPVAAALPPPAEPKLVVTYFHRTTGPPEYLKPPPERAPVAHKGDGLPDSGIEFKAETFDGTTAFVIKHPEMILPQWSTLPCVLETGIITGVSGVNPFRCRLTQDVSSTEGVVLMEKGTVIGGHYQSVVAEGQQRIVAVTANARTPNNVVVPLGGPIADDIGQAGVEGTVNNHWWARIGGALILSVLDAGVSLGQSALTNAMGSTSINIGSTGLGSGSPFSEVSKALLDKTINIPPTIQLKQGQTVLLWTTRWVDFSKVYALETRR